MPCDSWSYAPGTRPSCLRMETRVVLFLRHSRSDARASAGSSPQQATRMHVSTRNVPAGYVHQGRWASPPLRPLSGYLYLAPRIITVTTQRQGRELGRAIVTQHHLLSRTRSRYCLWELTVITITENSVANNLTPTVTSHHPLSRRRPRRAPSRRPTGPRPGSPPAHQDRPHRDGQAAQQEVRYGAMA